MAKRFDFTPEPMSYCRVLVVDDVDANIYVASKLLAFYGLEVDICESGYEALAYINSGKKYDIIFMDQMMPGMDGTETMLAMRKRGYKEPIVALTANALIGQAEKFVKAGFDGFISKPIQTKHLNTILLKYIRDKQSPEVINAAREANSNVGNSPSDAEMVATLRNDFLKKHKNTFRSLSGALDSSDTKTAHRLAHTLKGLAGLIKESSLARLSADVEYTLSDGKLPSAQQLGLLEAELTRVLESISVPIDEPVAGRKITNAEVLEILEKMQPLLENGNTNSLGLSQEFRELPEAAILCRQIEDFDFDAAVISLATLKSIMGG
jgi:CheY-like chemotaxis protein